MMLPFRVLLAVLIVLAVVSLSVPASLAQDAGDPLAAAVEQLQRARGYQFDFQLALHIDGVEPSPLRVDVEGSGTIASNDGSSALDLQLDGTLGLGPTQTPLNLHLRVVEDVLYVTDGQRPVWSGAHLHEVVPILEDVVVSSFRNGFNSGTQVTAGNRIAAGSTAEPGVREALDAFKRSLRSIDLNRFSVTQRLAEETIEGESVAHYTTALAVHDLMTSGDALNLLISLLQLGDSSVPAGFSGAEMNTVGQLVAKIFENTSVQVDRYVSLSDSSLRRAVVTLDMALDRAQLGETGAPISLGVHFDVQIANINGDLHVDRPQNAMVISNLAEVLGLPTVTASDGGSGPGLSPNLQEPTPALDPNAQPIVANVPMEISLEPGRPTDLVYTAVAAETVDVVARSLEEPGTLDPTVEVLTMSGTRLNYNDDHVSERDSLDATDSAIEGLELPAAGSYIIRVNTFTQAAEGRVQVVVESDLAPVPVQTPVVQEGGSAVVPISEDRMVISGIVPSQSSYTATFPGMQGQTVTITALAPPGSELDPKIALIGPGGSLLAENDDHEDADPNLRSYDARISSFTLPRTGEYRVDITGFGASGGPFELTIDFSGQAVVPTVSAPTSMSEQVVRGTVEEGGVYTYTLEANRGDVITLAAVRTSGDLDPVIRVYTASEEFLVSNDDHGTSDRGLDVLDARIENFIVPASGSYLVDVVSVGSTSGAFDLIITPVAENAPIGAPVEEVVVGEIEPGGSFTTTIDAQAGDFVTISVRALSGDMDPRVALLGPGGRVLVDNDDHGTSDGMLARYDARIENFLIPQTGTYTIEVTGYQTTSGGFGVTIGTLR